MATLIELPILALLAKTPMHGYEIRQRLAPMAGFVGAASYGSVYPMLKQLQGRAHLAATRKETARGPERVAYRVTAAGRRRLAELFADETTPLALKLLFFDRAVKGTRVRVLRKQRAAWAERLTMRREATQAVGDSAASRYRRALLERMFGQLERDLAWIDRLIIEEERT